MGDSRDSSISPMTAPRLASSINIDATAPSRGLSPLREAQTLESHPSAFDPANNGSDSRKNEPDEFPFGCEPGNPQDITTHGPSNELTMKSPAVPLSRKVATDDEPAPARRSVQFARTSTFESEPGHSRQQSGDIDDVDGKGKGKERDGSWRDNKDRDKEKQSVSLITKLKALASPISMPGHGRSMSAFAGTVPATDGAWPPSALSPSMGRYDGRYGDGDSEADADAEESAGEGPSRPPRRRRKIRRVLTERSDGTHTAPTTPKTAKPMPFFSRDSPGTTPTSTTHRPGFLRRATMTEIPEHQRQGVSEDEGRDRLAKERAWTRGLHSARGLSSAGLRRQDPSDGSERRPSNLRRLTGFASGGVDGAPSPWRFRGDRTGSMSAQRWAKLKAGLKMLGQRSKTDRQVDHTKSAELVAELLAGVPAVLLLASMFQRDEHGHKRIPILLEQLKVTISDSDKATDKTGERHGIFRIELEYGSGLTRMKWVIHRSLRDFTTLHLKYKVQEQTERLRLSPDESKRPKLPKFPMSVVPYMRGLRGYGALVDELEEEEGAGGEPSGPEGDASGIDRPPKAKRKGSSFLLGRRQSSMSSATPAPEAPTRTGSFAGPTAARLTHAEKQRRKLETYLSQLIRYVIFRPESNRLCKFLELSALGVRLAAEGGYHGKEGYMMIQSSKGVDFRKGWAPHLMTKRHTPKWFLVRHSYLVCVDSPEEMNVYDVFLVDSDFSIQSKIKGFRGKPKEIASAAKTSATHPTHHQLRLANSERKVKLLAKNEAQLQQFEDSIKFMMANTQWNCIQRFGSFAPVRKRIYAQWLVDGRDYMWNVSRAISMARDVVYIHDWWLSPELYMRRPAAISQKWRLDRLLQRKAQEGVKIFVIMYRNINTAIPIDSEYSKFSLLDLHPNVFVQRSPNQIRQNTFFWAHHEKICIVDHTIAFCGGVDLCFGRWDTPQHAVVDDKLTGFELDNDAPKDADHCQLWPGKDYSNPRVQDFYSLDKPYEEMYDRTKVPRMPWHDIGMQIVGQPARDLTRHFVQRWNYLLRQRKPSRPTPYLLPPPDFNPADIEALGLDGTCEVQILRSACAWSIGTPNKTEHSILTAYIQMIATSEHFVYIENQFFITSCEVENTKIENKIGDALVDRIKRAHKNQEDWRACIIIPLMPGFQNTVDTQEGSSVRLIMTCQYQSICRGETSIFGRLRKAGIEPEDYIQFYALRSWGAIGPTKALVTEQLYIHAKCMVVDDRVAIIGSANINERSMLGSRDSEVAAIVRDTEMIDSYMAGRPYKVGRFPHTLRMRLMREHLGVDTDCLTEDDWSQHSDVDSTHFHSDSSSPSSPTVDVSVEQKLTENKHRFQDDLIAKAERLKSFNHDVDWEQESSPHVGGNKKVSSDPRVMNNASHAKDLRGEGPDNMLEIEHLRPTLSHGRDSYVNASGQEVLLTDVAPENHSNNHKNGSKRERGRSNTITTKSSEAHSLPEGYSGLPPPRLPRMDTRALGLTQLSQLPALPNLDDTDIGGPPLLRTFSQASSSIVAPLLAEMRRPVITEDCMKDPVNDSFYLDIWHNVAENNTKLFRQVFRCMPDNEVKTWKEYKEYSAFAERFQQAQGAGKSTQRKQQESGGKSGPPGQGLADKISPHSGADMGKVEQWADEQEQRDPIPSVQQVNSPYVGNELNEKEIAAAVDGQAANGPSNFPPPPPIPNGTSTEDFGNGGNSSGVSRSRTVTYSEPPSTGRPHTGTGSQRRRRRATTKSSTRAFHAADENILLERDDAEKVLKLVQGHLVVWPYEWLESETKGGGWMYPVDQIAPLEIYT